MNQQQKDLILRALDDRLTTLDGLGWKEYDRADDIDKQVEVRDDLTEAGIEGLLLAAKQTHARGRVWFAKADAVREAREAFIASTA